jgi:SAM-dependent methyltransferase
VAAGEVRATSFGRVADDYDRLRPGPPDEALDWLVSPGCQTAIDVGAGTGLFSRALRRRIGGVIAVEPDERMRAVLMARSPDVRAVAGRGESIPLPDASADAVFVSSAWQWLDLERAVPEIARVLRDGGRLGVIATSRDRRVGWVAELDSLLGPDAARMAGDVNARVARRPEAMLPENAPFGAIARASFSFSRAVSLDDAVGWLATYSNVIMAPDGEREAGLARAREALLRRADAAGIVEIPVRSSCWRAERISR